MVEGEERHALAGWGLVRGDLGFEEFGFLGGV